MKKIFTFAVAACFGLSAAQMQAQTEEDVTSYIVNAGFDEDLTFQADGTRKTSSASGVTSSRSNFYVAEDSTSYAVARSISRSDGRTDAVNGFAGRIKGWTLTAPGTWPSYEWMYFGAIPYALGTEAVPKSDNTNGFILAPEEKPEGDNGDDNIGCLYLNAGWGNTVSYNQKVGLPCAQYRLEYWIYNSNYEASSANLSNVQNLCQVICRNETFPDDEGLTGSAWTKHQIEFTPTSDFTISFGYKSANTGSGNNPILNIDGLKLYKIGEADPVDLYLTDLTNLIDVCNAFLGDSLYNYNGLAEEFGNAIAAGEEAQELEDTLAIHQAIITLTAEYAKAEEAYKAIVQIETLQSQIQSVLSATNYPGASALTEASNNASNVLDTGNAVQLIAEAETLAQALQTYYLSQNATADNPADYTFFVKSPYFTQTAANPDIVYQDNNAGIASVTYPNDGSYTIGSAPADGSREGWVIGNSGGDQRLNYQQGRVCWNAWRQGNYAISINQDLTDLPDGYYTVSAELITQEGYVTDQHVYATSSFGGTVNSDPLTSAGWIDGDNGTWTYLTTPKILVVGGKLTIGAIGNNETSTANQSGWFCATNFRLMYYGEPTAEDINSAYQTRLKTYTDLLDSVYFSVDKSAYKAVLDAFSSASTTEAMLTALDTIVSAAEVAQASATKYKDVMAGSLNDLKTRLTDQTYDDSQITAANQAITSMGALMKAANATYTQMDSLTTILRYYRDQYLPTLGQADSIASKLQDATAKASMSATISNQMEKLQSIGTLATTTKLDEFIAELNKAIAICKSTDVIKSGSSDVTSLIVNPSINGSSNASIPMGWSAILESSGNGYYTNAGQAYNGESSNRYADAWNPTAGSLRYTLYQVIDNIPNGTYTLKAKMRATGTVGSEGIYLFGYDDANKTGVDSTAIKAVFAPAHIQATDSAYINTDLYTTKGQAYAYATDTYGPIWAEAAEEILFNSETTPSAEVEAIYAVNGNKGRGWFYNQLTVEVTNNRLIIGITCDSLLTAGSTDTEGNACVGFSGTWFSADDFTLTLDENKQQDYNPATGVETIENGKSLAPDAIFTLDGRCVNTLENAPRGIYVIRQNGKTHKVLKK